MAEIINFPTKKTIEQAFDMKPEQVQQAIAWDEWEHAVVILSRGDERQVVTCVESIQQANYLVDLAKHAIWDGHIDRMD